MNQNYQTYEENQTKTKKTLLYIIIILLLCIIIGVVGILLFTNTKKSYSRTVMIYMVGSDLESRKGFATVDLSPIDYKKTKSNNVNVILIAGGSPTWKNNYIDSDTTSIYRLEEDGFKKIKDQDLLNMGDADTLTHFLQYTYDNYKTDKYDLIFWNHGGAIDGSEYDRISDDHLTLKELEEGLNKSPFNQDNKLELVFFSTCLNGSLEMANTFKDYADYLVASEEVTMASDKISEFQFINEIKPTDTEVEIGKKHISIYRKKVNYIIEDDSYDDQIYSTYSIIKLSNIEELTKNINDFFADVDLTEDFYLLSSTRANVFQYGDTTKAFDMIDIYNFIEKIKDISPEKAKKIEDSFKKTIIYNWATDERSRGLSIYYPYNGEAYIKEYLKIYDGINYLDNYKSIINEFSKIKEKGYSGTPVRLKKDAKITTSTTTSTYDFEMELTDDELQDFASAKYIIYRDQKNGYFKPVYIGGKAELKENKITAQLKNRLLRVVALSDEKQTYPLVLNVKDENEKYIWIETDATLEYFGRNWDFQAVTYNMIIDKETNEMQIISIMEDNQDGLPTRIPARLEDYDAVVFSMIPDWKITDENGNYTGRAIDKTKESEGFEPKIDDYKFEFEKFDEEYDYYASFYITDVYGNTKYSNLIKMN